jgi:peptidyl-prolyl cis-trans isomerase SurA
MIKPRIFLSLLFLTAFLSSIFSQDILMTIGDKEITLDEFERIYNKNNSSITTNKQTPEEYLDLFINFKLKVIEAEKSGMDTTQKFLQEFNTYKDQLAQPYMTDEASKKQLMEEAYERMKWDIHISHILLGMDNQATPEDTLEAYEKAIEIRDRIIEGEDFSEVARATSDDPSVRMNGGDLGYFTVFMMVYPFETAAYNLENGEISMPVRTEYGYHILKRHDRRPAVGEVLLSHIFLATPEGSTDQKKEAAKSLALSLGDSIKMGVDFGELAMRHSDDRNSAVKGGELPWRGTGRYFREFEDKAFALKEPGDVTEPFKSFYGWHIVKLLDKKEIGSFDEMKSTLESRVGRGDRDRVKRKRYLDKLKNDYEFSLNEAGYKTLYTMVDSSVFKGEWKITGNDLGLDDPLFTITGEKITIGDFASHIEKIQRKRNPIPVENYVDMTFNEYLEDFLLDVEKASLPEKYPEYKHILQEYHDGILLFDLMDQKVWTRAVEDTTGLEAFFAEHRSDYMWGERMKALVVSCDSMVNVNKVHRKAKKIASGRWDEAKLNKKFCDDTATCISIEEVITEPGKNEHIDALNGITGTGNVYAEDGRFRFVILTEILAPTEKELNETRGQVTSDYQDHLEQLWIEELRNKYPVVVNKERLSEIE